MTRPRLLAAVLAAAIAAGSTVAAACELLCAGECERASSVSTARSGCHEERSPSSPRSCPDRHGPRLAVLDAKASSSFAAPAGILRGAPVLDRPLPELRSTPVVVVSWAPISASPPLVLRV